MSYKLALHMLVTSRADPASKVRVLAGDFGNTYQSRLITTSLL